MTAMTVSFPAAMGRGGHFGAWRAQGTIPAMVGSLLLILVLFGWMGQWEGAVLLGWIASGAVIFSRFGEHVAVRVRAGFRRPTKAQAALLAPPWATALARCGLEMTDVELYVQRNRDPNAFAAGGRSVAVTTGALAKFQGDRLGDQYLVAILVHDLLTAPVTGRKCPHAELCERRRRRAGLPTRPDPRLPRLIL